MAERWYLQYHGAQAEKQVTSYFFGPHTIEGILIHGRYYTEVTLDLFGSSEAADPLVLQSPQELCLNRQVKGINLIKKNSTSIGLLQNSLRLDRTGIGTLFRSEKGTL